MFIHVQDPTLNRNLGKYQLPPIWDHLLLASPTLQCKPSSLPTTPIPNPLPYWLLPHPPPTLMLALVKVKQNMKISTNQGTGKNTDKTGSNNKPYIVVPYIQGMSESCKKICRKHGVEMYFKRGNTIKDLLVHPKDKDNILQKSGVIYRFRCDRVDCDEEYIGESGRTFAERFREHMRTPSPIHDHHNTTGHELSLDNFSIVGREDQSTARTIKEAILIRVNDPSLNRNIGKYQLPHIWDEVLVKSPELKFK